ncbi:MAG: excinuclease ABC subunit UvrA, partial [Flavobacteriaceae bacterium]
IKARKGHYRELFDNLQRQGFIRVRIDGEIVDLKPGMKVDRYKTHDIELVVDRLTVSTNEGQQKRLKESVDTALRYGEDSLLVHDLEDETVRYFSRNLMCPSTGISYPMPEPNSFS